MFKKKETDKRVSTTTVQLKRCFLEISGSGISLLDSNVARRERDETKLGKQKLVWAGFRITAHLGQHTQGCLVRAN